MDTTVEGLKRRIDEALRTRGIARKDLAERIGAKPSTVSEWYTKKAKPSVAHVLRLPEALNVSADWLLFGVGSMDRAQHENGADSFAAGAAYAVRKMMETLLELGDAIGQPGDGGRERTPEELERLERLAWLAQVVLRRQGQDRRQTRDGGE